MPNHIPEPPVNASSLVVPGKGSKLLGVDNIEYLFLCKKFQDRTLNGGTAHEYNQVYKNVDTNTWVSFDITYKSFSNFGGTNSLSDIGKASLYNNTVVNFAVRLNDPSSIFWPNMPKQNCTP